MIIVDSYGDEKHNPRLPDDWRIVWGEPEERLPEECTHDKNGRVEIEFNCWEHPYTYAEATVENLRDGEWSETEISGWLSDETTPVAWDEAEPFRAVENTLIAKVLASLGK